MLFWMLLRLGGGEPTSSFHHQRLTNHKFTTPIFPIITHLRVWNKSDDLLVPGSLVSPTAPQSFLLNLNGIIAPQ